MSISFRVNLKLLGKYFKASGGSSHITGNGYFVTGLGCGAGKDMFSLASGAAQDSNVNSD